MAASATANWKGSIEYWEKLEAIYLAKFESKPSSYRYLPLADAQAHLGQVDKAIKTLEYGLALKSGSRAAKVLLAQLYYDTGEEGKAKDLLVEVVSRWPDVLAGVSLLLKIYEEEGDINSAREISRKVSYYYPDSLFVQKVADSYESMAGGEAMVGESPVGEAPAETEKEEHLEDDFAEIMIEEAVAPQLSSEPAPLVDDSQNGGTMTEGKRKSLLILESMLDRITRIRNEGMV